MTQMLEMNAHTEPDGLQTEEGFKAGLPAYHRVVLLGRHPLMLVGLRETLNRSLHFSVTGEGCNASQALAIISRQRVNLLIIDQARPGAALPWLQNLQPYIAGRVPVVALGTDETPEEIEQLYSAGAGFFASKEARWSAIYQLLRQAVAGSQPLSGPRSYSPPPTGWPGWLATRQLAGLPAGKQPASPLSRRELEILSVIAQGFNNKDVAEILCISGHTLKNHLNNIFKKLEVEDRTQALMLGLRQGWVQL